MQNNKLSHNVDVVVKFFYPLWAGIEVNVANVYGFMAQKGWQVNLHTTKDLPDAKNSLPDKAVFRGIKVNRYRWQWWGFLPKIDWEKTEAVCLHNFDIFPHSWILAYAGLRKIFGIKTPKIFLTPHGGFTIATGWHTYPLWQRLIKRTYQATLGVFLINHVVDGFRSVSEWEGEEAVKNGLNPEKLYVITNGLEDEAYGDIDNLASPKVKKIAEDLGKYVLQIGRIHPIKNQATTIKAMAEVPKNVRFAMIGPVTNFEYEKELKELIKKLGLEQRIKFLGVISGTDKYYLLKHCLAYSHMSTWESYCNTVHESMSQGCVCVVSKDTALEELIQDKVTGFAVQVMDYHAVAEKINYVINNLDSEFIRKIRENSIKFTQGHSWREISGQVAQMYNHYFPEPQK